MPEWLLWVLTVGGAILVGAYCGLVAYFLLHETRRYERQILPTRAKQ